MADDSDKLSEWQVRTSVSHYKNERTAEGEALAYQLHADTPIFNEIVTERIRKSKPPYPPVIQKALSKRQMYMEAPGVAPFARMYNNSYVYCWLCAFGMHVCRWCRCASDHTEEIHYECAREIPQGEDLSEYLPLRRTRDAEGNVIFKYTGSNLTRFNNDWNSWEFNEINALAHWLTGLLSISSC